MNVFGTTVGELHQNYLRPQENGSHYNCHFIQTGSFAVRGKRLFSFSASEYTIREITEKRHNYEMEKVRQVVVCTDYKMSSVGSNFCDPEFLPQYRFAEEEFKWEMLYFFFDRD